MNQLGHDALEGDAGLHGGLPAQLDYAVSTLTGFDKCAGVHC